MVRVSSRVILPAITATLGVLWVVVGLFVYGWWIDGRPASGFFPTVVGFLLAVVSGMAIAGEFRSAPPGFFLYHAYPTLAAVSVVLAAMLIGFFPALAIYCFCWIRWFEKYSWRFSILLTVGTIGGVYAIFRLWLRVPFPGGLIAQLVAG